MKQIQDMTKKELLEYAEIELLRVAAEKLEARELDKGDFGSIATLMKNNKMVEEKKIESESDLIDGLIDDL